MAEGRGKFEWNQTSCLMALIVNVFRDPKKSKGAKPADFNPYVKKVKIPAPLTVLRDIWCKKGESDGGSKR